MVTADKLKCAERELAMRIPPERVPEALRKVTDDFRRATDSFFADQEKEYTVIEELTIMRALVAELEEIAEEDAGFEVSRLEAELAGKGDGT